MASKVLVVFGVLLVSLLLISSEVGARDLAEDSQQEKTTQEAVKTNVENANYYGGYGCYYHCCSYGSCYCCSKAEACQMETDAKLHN